MDFFEDLLEDVFNKKKKKNSRLHHDDNYNQLEYDERKHENHNINPQRYNSCHRCGANNSPDSKFCSNCGISLNASLYCNSCGAKVQPEAKFCPACGRKV